MSDYFILAIFPFVLFFLAAALVTGAPVAMALQDYYKNRGRKSVKCPENGRPVDVEVDNVYAFQTSLRGLEHSRLQSCSRWPEKGDCGQECLAQVDPSPENLERLLSKWSDGKSCAICARAIIPGDWRQGRLGVLNQHQELFQLRDMNADDLQSTLEQTRPLCWKCHQQERTRQVVPHKIFKGDRFGLASLHEGLE
jgi:hypothetical protein